MDTTATLDIPMENDVFVICEGFNDVFAELAGVYSRCAYWEKKKPENERDMEKLVQWHNRSSELAILRRNYEQIGWKEKKDLVGFYNKELKAMFNTEDLIMEETKVF